MIFPNGRLVAENYEFHMEEGYWDLRGSNLQVWINKKEYVALSFNENEMSVSTSFNEKYFYIVMGVCFLYKNFIFFKRPPIFFLNDSELNFEVDEATLRRYISSLSKTLESTGTVKITFENLDDYELSRTLLIWLENSAYEDYYLKHLEERRLEKFYEKNTSIGNDKTGNHANK